MIRFSVQENKSINLTQNKCLDDISRQYQSAWVSIMRLIFTYFAWKDTWPLGVTRNGQMSNESTLLITLRRSYCVECGCIHNLCRVCATEPPILPGEPFCGLFLSQMSGLAKSARALMGCWEKDGMCALGQTTAQGIMDPTEGGGEGCGEGVVSRCALLSFLSDTVHHTSLFRALIWWCKIRMR